MTPEIATLKTTYLAAISDYDGQDYDSAEQQAQSVIDVLVGVALPGDYDRNDIVDATDYLLYRNTLGQSVPRFSGADGNGDGQVAMDDLEVWRSNFGVQFPTSIAATDPATSSLRTPRAAGHTHLTVTSALTASSSAKGTSVPAATSALWAMFLIVEGAVTEPSMTQIAATAIELAHEQGAEWQPAEMQSHTIDQVFSLIDRSDAVGEHGRPERVDADLGELWLGNDPWPANRLF